MTALCEDEIGVIRISQELNIWYSSLDIQHGNHMCANYNYVYILYMRLDLKTKETNMSGLQLGDRHLFSTLI